MRNLRRRGARVFTLTSALVFLAMTPFARGQAFTVLHSFTSGGGSPYAGLTEAPDGTLYGTTAGGGLWGQGSVFALTPDGGGGFTYSVLHSFTGGSDGASPRAALLLASDGNLYGTSYYGFVAKYGTVFRMDTAGNLTVLYEFLGFGDGANPPSKLLEASDGNLYGVTESGGASPGLGTIFRMDFSGTLTTLHRFTGGNAGAFPRGELFEGSDGNLYGTTSSGGPSNDVGTIYRISLAGVFETIHNFTGSDGANPAAGLTLGPDGFFYGTTQYGGDNDQGTVFRTDTSGTVTSFSLSPFGNPVAPLVVADDGNLYGTTPSTVFRFTTSGTFTTIHTFSGYEAFWVLAPVLQAQDGLLYGTSAQSDTGFGRVYRLDTEGSNFESVHAFTRGNSARNPLFALFQGGDGNLYGTAGGGSFDRGTVFRLDSAGNETVLHEFDGTDGEVPSGLVRTPDGRLFGTALFGGASNRGTVFEIDTAGSFSLSHEFAPEDGALPFFLTLASDGTLYGATSNSPSTSGGDGTLYHIDGVGAFSTLHVFSESGEARYPSGDFVEMSDGSFIGVSMSGGENDLGALFRFDPSGTVEILHSFSGGDGASPSGPPVPAPDGNLYGLTQQGGTNNWGTIYRVSPSGRVTTIHLFAGSDGIYPTGRPVVGHDGNLYGTTRFGGTDGFGTVFRSNGSGNVVTLHSFVGSDGKEPQSQLSEGFDGGLYGATQLGGLFGAGVVFRVAAPPALSVWTVTPSSGPASGGTPVSVTGFNFSFPSVTIGGAAATNVALVSPQELTAVTPALPAGTLNDIVVTNSFDGFTGTLAKAWMADFLDVPQADIFHAAVETVFRSGITAGCGAGLYCRDDAVSRAQMAVFLLKGKHGAGYVPPACIGVFADVPCPGTFTDWIEQLSAEGITGGCSEGNFCPGVPVTRAQMAVFLLKAKHGSSFTPPTCAGVFGDVPCPSLFADWIEQLYAENITGGCQASPLLYCPGAQSTRGQMAVFLVKTFSLP